MKEIKIKGLDCPNCALELEEKLKKLDGVTNCNVSFITQKITIDCDDKNIDEAKNIINNFEEVKIVEDDNECYEEKKEFDFDLIKLIIGFTIFVVTFILTKISSENLSNIFSYIGYLLSYIIVGYEVIWKMILSIKNKEFFDENTLMSVASIGAILISIFSHENLLSEAAMVMLLYQLGEYLEDKATDNSRNQIESLVKLKSEKANLFVYGETISVEPEELNIDDIILVKAGEKVPVDILVLESNSSLDMKHLTGESMPVDVKTNDKVLAGSIVINGLIKGKVINRYENSAVAKILNLVQNSLDKKAKPEKFISKFARIYTPIVFFIAFIIFVIGLIITLATNNNLIVDFTLRALKVLVISCPCALVISIPLTYFSAIGAAAKKGILIKGANNLDNLANVDVAIFDKTGTLTYGSFEIVNTISNNLKLMDEIAYNLEYYSNHPISSSFKKMDVKKLEVKDFKEHFGFGLSGIIGNKLAVIGNYKHVSKYAKFDEVKSNDTILYVAYDNNYLGTYFISDKLREETKDVLNNLKELGIKETVLLTGDTKEKTDNFVSDLNLDIVKSGLLPEDKFNEVTNLLKDYNTLYVGDGINDVPVMVASTSAFSMGKLGSDQAVEASDFVLIKDDLKGVLDAYKISKKTKRIAYQNIIIPIIFKFVMMILGGLNLVPLWLAVFSDVGIMLLAVLNSLRVRKIK